MTIHVSPVRRNLNFHLPKERISDWNSAGPQFTHFLNALSIFFPEGERFFISSVRNFREEITDEQLKKDVRNFIAQEAFHTREHEEYNEALAQAGFPVTRYEGIVKKLLGFVKKVAPKDAQLAATVALEHLTAILAHTLLNNEEILEDSDEHFSLVWRWHALEETEHKAVAFDVYKTVMGDGVYSYLLRVNTFVIANVLFWSLVIPFHLDIIRRDKKLTDIKGWWQATQYLWGRPGALRKIIPDWLDYFKPSFHPWDHDNREFLSLAEELDEAVSAKLVSQA